MAVRSAPPVPVRQMPAPGPRPSAASEPASDVEKNFRFYDNRQKYLLFVTTCGEKWVIADRVNHELANIHPRPPAVRLFDAGVGDGTVLSRVMRAMHHRYPTMPLYIVAQGDQPGGRAAQPREDAGPLLRASLDRPRHDQHELCRGAVADAELGAGGDEHGLARGRALRPHRPRFRAADHRAAAFPVAAIGARRSVPNPAIRSTRSRSCSCSTVTITASCSTRCGRAAALRVPTTTSSSPRSPIAPAPR